MSNTLSDERIKAAASHIYNLGRDGKGFTDADAIAFFHDLLAANTQAAPAPQHPISSVYLDEIDAEKAGLEYLHSKSVGLKEPHIVYPETSTDAKMPRTKTVALFDTNDVLHAAFILTREYFNRTQLTLVDAKAVGEQPQPSQKQQKRLVIDLSEDDSLKLYDYIDGGDRPVSLIVSDGVAGYGLYVFDTEYPDEAAEFICAMKRPVGEPAEQQKIDCTCCGWPTPIIEAGADHICHTCLDNDLHRMDYKMIPASSEKTTFKERLKVAIRASGLSQRELAEKTDLDEPSVSHMLAGDRKPGLSTLEKILLALPDANARWLITGKGNKS